MTSFRFDQTLRDSIAAHLRQFEVRRRPDPGSLKHAAVAIVVAEADTAGEAAFLLTRRTPRGTPWSRCGTGL